MGRTGRRVSRGLIALTVVVAAIGSIFYITKPRQIGASESRNATPRSAVPLLAAPTTRPATPTTQPQPLSAPVNPPTTQPKDHSTPASQSTPTDQLARGLAAKDKGQLLPARELLNAALQSGDLNPADTDRTKAAISEISQTLVFSPKRFADDIYGGTYSVKSGELLKNIADQHEITWELLCRINGLSDPRKLRAGATIKVINGPFHAVVSKSAFSMDLYVGAAPGEKGSMYVMSYPVGLGADDSTPTGVWMVEPHRKIKDPTYYSPRGEGVIDAKDPKNPLGERWIGLTGIDGHAVGKESYGIHGTIEPDSIGKQASMGCIRLRNEDVEKLFEMLIEGKSLVIVKE